MNTAQLAVANSLPNATPNPTELSQERPTLSASQKRALNPLFVPTWSIEALLPKLPLRFPVEPDLPPSPKRHYRSQYRYLGPEPLLDPTRRANLTDFQIALYLIDFSPLEPRLARIYVPSLKGQVPFHPVSMFLGNCLHREQAESWTGAARLIAGEDGANWRKLLGFDQETPSASGLRYFYNVLGADVFDELCSRFITLLRQHGLFPETSTYPGDPPTRGITITQDGMLHPARSRPSCELAEDTCYQPLDGQPLDGQALDGQPLDGQPLDGQALDGQALETSALAAPKAEPGAAEPGASRPCRARQHGGEGCACDSAACQQQCRRASRLDPEARFIHYAGHNHKHGDQSQASGSSDQTPTKPQAKSDNAAKGPGGGINVFGYRSVVDRAIDDRFSVAWNLQTGLYSASTDERAIFEPRLDGLKTKYPDLRIGEWLDDSGVGYGPCLEAIYELGALRLVDIRADPSDHDWQACLRRGYDGQGCPLCPHGYPMRSNGYDYARRRTKYVCAQVCRRQPLRDKESVAPVKGCPYLGEPGCSTLGYVVNVGKTMPSDGSLRLAREIPYGSPTWKARYGRRNLSESRNGQIERMGLKRMQSYGLTRSTKDVQLADFLISERRWAGW